MPVLSLPLDVVAIILSNFHATPTSPEDALNAATAAGKAVSLVCRTWSPLGQALPGRQVKIDLSQTSSLLTTLESLNIRNLDDEDQFIEPSIGIWTFLDLMSQSLPLFRLPQVEWDRDNFHEFHDARLHRMQGKKPYRQLTTLSSRFQPLVLFEYATEDGKQWCQ